MPNSAANQSTQDGRALQGMLRLSHPVGTGHSVALLLEPAFSDGEGRFGLGIEVTISATQQQSINPQPPIFNFLHNTVIQFIAL